MKNYKEYEKVIIGASDKGSLELFGMIGGKLDTVMLNFGEDGIYSAYLVDKNAEIGSHYTEVARFNDILAIYDDDDDDPLTWYYKEFRVYRAGMMGCIIQLIK